MRLRAAVCLFGFATWGALAPAPGLGLGAYGLLQKYHFHALEGDPRA